MAQEGNGESSRGVLVGLHGKDGGIIESDAQRKFRQSSTRGVIDTKLHGRSRMDDLGEEIATGYGKPADRSDPLNAFNAENTEEVRAYRPHVKTRKGRLLSF